MSMNIQAVWGLAGSGKTTWLADMLNNNKDKYNPSNTLLLTFSRMAKKMLNEKLQKNGNKLQVSTFHSFIAQRYIKRGFAYSPLSLNEISEFFEARNFQKIRVRYALGGIYQETGHFYDHINRCRLMLKEPAEYWEEYADKAIYSITPDDFRKIYNDYEQFMHTKKKYDYAETLLLGLGLDIKMDFVIIDEANDLSELIYLLAKKYCKDTMLLVGDPNQNIYTFAGSSDKYLTQHDTIKQLTVSYRCCDEIANYASKYQLFGEKIKGNGTRGTIRYGGSLLEFLDPAKDTLLLTYRIKTAEKISSRLCADGIPHRLFGEFPFSTKIADIINFWFKLQTDSIKAKDLVLIKHIGASIIKGKTKLLRLIKGMGDYEISSVPELPPVLEVLKKMKLHGICFAAGLSGTDTEFVVELSKDTRWLDPKINIMNVHKAKGAEADTVIMCLDIPAQEYQDAQSVNKIIYTAATRAKKELYILN